MIRRAILSILANSVGLWLVDYFLGGVCLVGASVESCPAEPNINFWALAGAGFLLGILNLFVKPFLKIIALPITFLTAGLFLFVVNGLVFALFVWLVNIFGFENLRIIVADPAWVNYLYSAIILGAFNFLTHWLIRR